MSVFGFHCRTRNDQPSVIGVELTGPRATATLGRIFRFTANRHQPRAQQLHLLADAIATELGHNPPSAVVVRLPDRPGRQQPAQEVTMLHGMVDGVMLAMAHEASAVVVGLRGVDVARTCGTDKQTLLDDAAGRFGQPLAEAAAAAFAALELAGEA